MRPSGCRAPRRARDVPIFEYRCARCGEESSQLVRKPEDVPQNCDACGSRKLERLLSAPNVRTTRVDPSALRATSREISARPERFGEAMTALEARTGVKIERDRVDAAIDSLAQAKKSGAAEAAPTRTRKKGRS